MNTSLRAYLFGTFEIYQAEARLPLPGSGSAQSLLAYLCFKHPQPISRAVLAGTFWPEQTESSARRALSQALWHIRRAVPNLILATAQTIQIAPETVLWIDVTQFQARLTPRDQKPIPGNNLQEAAQLYRGELLNGFYDEWIFIERESLREQYLQTLETLIHQRKSTGHYVEALEYGRQLAQADPLRESVYRTLMQINLALGRAETALQVFETCRQTLQTELGLEPEAETLALAREIQTQSTGAELPYLPPQTPLSPPLLADEAQQLPLVGREPERLALITCVEGIHEHRGGLVMIEGDAGIGKTRLLQEARRDAKWRGVQTLWGSCQEIEGVTPDQALVEAVQTGLTPLRVTQLTQLVDDIWRQVLMPIMPDLAIQDSQQAPPPALAADRASARLHNAFLKLLTAWAKINPLLLIIEDIHWAGNDLLEILLALAAGLRDQPALIFVTYRGEDVRANPKQWEQIQKLDRAGLRERLLLDGLKRAGAGELVRRALRLANPAPLFEERIHHETGGNPLFLLETLRSLLEENVLTQDANGNWHTPWDETTANYGELPTPPAVEGVIARRLENLPSPFAETLNLSAVLGETFDFTTLHAVSEIALPQLLSTLSELGRRRFIIETAEQYAFNHARVREVIYREIPAATRRAYHRRVGEKLEELAPDQIAQLAHHFYQAKRWEKNLYYSQLAGDQAAKNYANREALGHYSRALTLLPAEKAAERYNLLLARERIYALLGEYEAQQQDLSALQTLAEQLNDKLLQIEVEIRQARYAEALGEYEQAAQSAQKAVILSDEPASTCAVEGWLLWGIALRRLGQYSQAEEKIAQALLHAEAARHKGLEAEALSALGIARAYQSDYPGAQNYFQQALAIYQDLGDRPGEGKTLNLLGVQQDYLGDYKRAEDFYQQALQIHHQTGDRRGEGDALLNIGVALANLGDNTRALQHYQQALTIYLESGYQQGQSWVLGNLGSVATELGDFHSAQDYFEQALSISRKMGDQQGECAACAQICLNLRALEDYETAQIYGQKALNLAAEIKDRYLLNYAYLYLGHAYAGLGDWAQAQQAYQQALDIRRELEEFNLAMEALAGLARVSLARGACEQAQLHVNEILDFLAQRTLDGCDEPVEVYFICYRTLKVNEDPRQTAILETAYAQLQARAAQIDDDEMRRSFLENIPHHRELIAAYQAWQTHQNGEQIEARLPKLGAPTGRPLREDEWVAVSWTVAKPGDEKILGKRNQRQHRVLRLLAEAASQGAAPTLEDLSEALGVSLPTIKRDLAALRKQGHLVQTRGSRTI